MLARFIPAQSSARLAHGRRILACFLLTATVVLLVLNPLWECHDRMDNLRHLGPNGILAVFLIFACAGITLFKSLRWGLPGGSLLPLPACKLLIIRRFDVRSAVLSISSADLVLPLRV